MIPLPPVDETEVVQRDRNGWMRTAKCLLTNRQRSCVKFDRTLEVPAAIADETKVEDIIRDLRMIRSEHPFPNGQGPPVPLLGGGVVVGEQGDARQPADRLGGGEAVGARSLFTYGERFSIQLFSARIVAQRKLGPRDPVHVVTQLDAGGTRRSAMATSKARWAVAAASCTLPLSCCRSVKVASDCATITCAAPARRSRMVRPSLTSGSAS